MQRRLFHVSLTTLALASGSLTAALLFAGPRESPQQQQESAVQFEQPSLLPNQMGQQQQQQQEHPGVRRPRQHSQQTRLPQQQLPKPKLQPRHFQHLQHTPIMQGSRRR
ncbi:MAG: hypothetical protein U0939_22290 [Pirellulales bacterium]